MPDEVGNGDTAPSGGRPRDASNVPHSLDANDDGKPELRGALPPLGPNKALRKADDVPQPDAKTALRGLRGLGPWKRWRWYREIRQHERDEPNFWRDRDPSENARGRLPNDEGIEVPAVWVAELYTPSTVGGLLDGIRDLGWEYGRSRDDSLTKWMNDVREGRQAGWTSLGLVSPPEDAHFMSERVAPLPDGVRAALPVLMSLTPSLTALTIVFLLRDDAAASLDQPLRAEYMTTTHRDPLLRPWHVIRYVLANGEARFGRSIYHPDMTRRMEVRSCIRDLESSCTAWVREYLPGAFSSLDDARNPTAALFVTEEVRPMSEEARSIRALDGLAINRDYDAWESAEWPGARLVLPRGWDDEGTRLVFACRRRDAFPDRPGYHDPTSNWTIAQRADDLVRGLLSRWALTCLLDRYHQTLSALRDRTALNSRYRPVRDLKKLRSLARTTLYDIGACAHEIMEFAESDARFKRYVLEMVYAREVNGKKPDLLNDLRSSQVARAQQVQREADLLRSTLSTSNDVSQTISNIRIQRLVVWLTLISLGVALWAAYLSFMAA